MEHASVPLFLPLVPSLSYILFFILYIFTLLSCCFPLQVPFSTIFYSLLILHCFFLPLYSLHFLQSSFIPVFHSSRQFIYLSFPTQFLLFSASPYSFPFSLFSSFYFASHSINPPFSYSNSLLFSLLNLLQLVFLCFSLFVSFFP